MTSVPGWRARHPPAGTSACRDVDAARPRVLDLRDAQPEHALLQFRREMLRVQFLRQREHAPVARQAHLGVRSLHTLRHVEGHLALDRERFAVYLQVQLILGHPGQIGVEGDAGGILDHVHRRQQGGIFARRLGRPIDCGTVVHGFVLRH